MPVLFEAAGTDPGPRTFDRRASGSFSGTHPGADGPNGVVLLPVTGYRSSGRPVTVTAFYGDDEIPMVATRQLWGNAVSDRQPNSGWLQFFYLLNPPPGPQPWRVEWVSPIGAIAQIQMRAKSLSYTGMIGIGEPALAAGAGFGTTLAHTVTAPDDALIVNGVMQEWTTALADYNRTLRTRLDDASTGRPYDCIIGEAAGGQSVKFTGRRMLGAAWASVALPLIAARGNTVTPKPAQIVIRGHAAPPPGQTVVIPRAARITVTGHPAVARVHRTIRPAPAQIRITGYQPWTGLPIFPAATVLTLRGANLFGDLNPNDMPQKFQGIFAEDPYDMHEVVYPASLRNDSITRGVKAFDNALHHYDPPFIGLCTSQGAQVASAWMEEHRDDPDAPSEDELQFVLSGNPISSKGGYLIGRPVVGGGLGEPTPTDTKWLIVDVAIRYEGWTDWVQDETDPVAVQNAMSGRGRLHTRYHTVDLFDPTHTIWRNGNTLYVLTQPVEIPFFKGKPQPDSVVSALRVRCEAAYTNRPPNEELPEPVAPANSFERNLIAQVLPS